MDCADLTCIDGPKQVGIVVDVQMDEVLTILTFQDSLGEARSIVLAVSRAKIRALGSTVWFDELDCAESASAWIRLAPGDVGISAGSGGNFFPPAIEEYALVSDTSDPTVRSLWVATDSTVFSGESVSTATRNGCESPKAESFSGVPAEKIVDDLHADFPPPYTLEIIE